MTGLPLRRIVWPRAMVMSGRPFGPEPTVDLVAPRTPPAPTRHPEVAPQQAH